jgi:hypothetical protein
MRQLSISETSSSAIEAEKAEALRVLQSLPAPPHVSPALTEEFSPEGLCFIVSVAAQYQGPGLRLAELAKAGFEAAVQYGSHYKKAVPGQPSWAWWVREGMLAALVKKYTFYDFIK